jgi:hypothetical protein
MIRSTHVLAVLALVAAPLSAQRGRGNATAAPGIAVSTTAMVWKEFSTNVLESAEEMPEAKFAFKATPAVRSFGQLIGHVAGSQYMFCAAALGEKMPSEDDIEKTKTTKADLIAALKASNDYCAKAYAMSDAAARMTIEMFGSKQTKLWALAMNAAHDAEQYGSIVTYLRLNGLVPPSSKK